MNEELLEHKVKVNENRINNHADRIDKLEQSQAEMKIEIKNLVKSLDSLTAALKWLIGLLGGSIAGFFFYAIQTHMFK
ncbi:MAG: hemolysin XhlA family protein [Clostridium chrysemydis]|uniref:hemolysin XhlA family protein n=1 Tax=Clostridium chrysemydis TaxID=2665504 RepID=UPI003F33DD60